MKDRIIAYSLLAIAFTGLCLLIGWMGYQIGISN
jgi:hypothetical protein